MSTFTLPINILVAARTHCAIKDPRYYLRGICVDFARGRVMATDGKRLFIAGVPVTDAGASVGQVLISNELLDQAIKAYKKADTVELTIDGTKLTFSALGMVITGAMMDGRFPDVDRVIPDTVSGELAQYDAEFIADANKALIIATDAKKGTLYPLLHNGAYAGVMFAEQANGLPVLSIIMPYRCDMSADTASAVCRAVKRANLPAPDAAQAA